MKSSIVKRSVTLHGRRTSVSLEDAFWKALREIAYHQHVSLAHLIESINTNRKRGNLSSAVRLFVLELYQDQIRPLKPSKPEIGRRPRVG
jgi:predicted DNA-binding ribbon-helix-helix protein